ncbi:testis-specific serine/threonine-protein kinase 4 [Latimeria chalumnae]|uniref:non-specific serine/threonine protein kinase n=1 Tax=Latimeria chalumnae TaxID=7897 RepID=H3A8M8_LATCH|nr:PREDICTED: testis-specific serine/threonine-protein kinase 4 [Latimeria chalumnae]XP_014354008.1 PREDICTED: testis-specific serine/threonine-protein kinase 4 [Latimeria chalumnae]|eukprot:XP_006012410.1 PREDICTED: testis-specific serine/threonine-protein kinase 4 [Latimeria chalumnae]
MDKKDQPQTLSSPVLEEYGYKLGRMIGYGSYGSVHEAYFEKWKCNVAIKIISKKKAAQDFLNKFMQREIQVMRLIRHKNVISFYQSIETTSRVYIILELAAGGDVLDRVRERGPCSESTAGKWFSQLSLGIAFLQSKGIIHRDLKLENLLLDKRENLKISDFGFAKLAASGSQWNILTPPSLCETFCGSYAYAPPEILMGVKYNPFLVDIWSMGVILFTIVTARLPYDDSNLKKLLKEIQQEVVFPEGKPVPEGCKNLIKKILVPESTRVNIVKVFQDPWLIQFIQTQPSEMNFLENRCNPTEETPVTTATVSTELSSKAESLPPSTDAKLPKSNSIIKKRNHTSLPNQEIAQSFHNLALKPQKSLGL